MASTTPPWTPLSSPGILKLALDEWPGADERWDTLAIVVQVTEARGPNTSGLAWLRVCDGRYVFQLSFRSRAVNDMLSRGVLRPAAVVLLRGFKRRVVLFESRSASAPPKHRPLFAHLQAQIQGD